MRVLVYLIATTLILLIPLIAMQFTSEVNWTLSDFIIAGSLLLGTAIIYEVSTMNVKKTRYRLAIGISILIILSAIWITLAT